MHQYKVDIGLRRTDQAANECTIWDVVYGDHQKTAKIIEQRRRKVHKCMQQQTGKEEGSSCSSHLDRWY